MYSSDLVLYLVRTMLNVSMYVIAHAKLGDRLKKKKTVKTDATEAEIFWLLVHIVTQKHKTSRFLIHIFLLDLSFLSFRPHSPDVNASLNICL